MADLDDESSEETESSEGSDMDVIEEAAERGREPHPRVIMSSWHIQLSMAATRGDRPWECRLPSHQVARLKQAGWIGQAYMQLRGLREAFEEIPNAGAMPESSSTGSAVVLYSVPLFQERFLPLWVKNPSAIHSWINFVKSQEKGLGATHCPVRHLKCPVPHGLERLKWLQKIYGEMQATGKQGPRFHRKATHASMTVGDVVAIEEHTYMAAFDGFYVVNLNRADGHDVNDDFVRMEDTFGIGEEDGKKVLQLEEKGARKGKGKGKGKRNKKNKGHDLEHTWPGKGGKGGDGGNTNHTEEQSGQPGKGKKKNKNNKWQSKPTEAPQNYGSPNGDGFAKGKGKSKGKKGSKGSKGWWQNKQSGEAPPNYGSVEADGWGKGVDAGWGKGAKGKGKSGKSKGKGWWSKADGRTDENAGYGGWGKEGKGKGKSKGKQGWWSN
ncbi:Ribosomal RNA large subunit methyltransferase F [Durusdinium trenchii]|uniref:Ribosomal RNA large subunit methyltransferase F n=1 Tax=Durusdinium trenchii TaxID=1381693 RepID=A0ABP0S9G3_9DINO